MEQHKEINWSEVARQAIWEKMLILERMNQMLSQSRLRAADIEQVSYRIKKRISRKHKA